MVFNPYESLWYYAVQENIDGAYKFKLTVESD